MGFNYKPKGILHLGAGQAEELGWYESFIPKPEIVLWVDANPYTIKTVQDKIKDLPNHQFVHALLSDTDNLERDFNISDNFGSSSILPLKDHKIFYPTVHVKQIIKMNTTTVDTLLDKHKLDPSLFDMANLDLQGAEMFVLRGMNKVLQYLKYMCIEINFYEMYAGCALVNEIDKFLTEEGFKQVSIINTGMGWGEAHYSRIG